MRVYYALILCMRVSVLVCPLRNKSFQHPLNFLANKRTHMSVFSFARTHCIWGVAMQDLGYDVRTRLATGSSRSRNGLLVSGPLLSAFFFIMACVTLSNGAEVFLD